jgi:N-acyl-D-amino-acid deacylase
VTSLMRHPAMMGGSDGIFAGGRPHPRGWGCFGRYLGHYVREARTWTLEEAVQHLAAHPARRLGLVDRGLVRPGMAADLVVFDAARIGDRATYADGRQPATGVDHVLVNGEPVLVDGQRTSALPGRALRPARA